MNGQKWLKTYINLRMKNIVITITLLFVSVYGVFAVNPKADFKVVPLPQTIEISSSAPFILNIKSKIYYKKEQEHNAMFLQHYISDITGIKLKLTDKTQKNNVIILASKNEISGNSEKYILTVNKKEIRITGNSSAGVFYGIQTLRKALPVVQAGKVEIPTTLRNPDWVQNDCSIDLPNTDVRFVKVFAKNYDELPKGHPEAGGKPWLMVDEIMVE